MISANIAGSVVKTLLLVILLSQTGGAQIVFQAEYKNMEICKKNGQDAAAHFLGATTSNSYQIVCAPWFVTIGGNR